MNADEFKQIRIDAGLSLRELGDLLRVSDARTLRRWEDGEKEISGPVSVLMELLRDGDWPVDADARWDDADEAGTDEVF